MGAAVFGAVDAKLTGPACAVKAMTENRLVNVLETWELDPLGTPRALIAPSVTRVEVESVPGLSPGTFRGAFSRDRRGSRRARLGMPSR
jgi:hypothetical protein